VAGERGAVLLDWGGVMTTSLFDSFAAFCTTEGLEAGALRDLFRDDRDARTLLIDFECGRIDEEEFEPKLAHALGVGDHAQLIDRLVAGATTDQAMVDGVRRLHDDGVPTGLVSNSWGTRRYPKDLIAELFDGVVISGEVGLRKPDPAIYEMGAERVGLPPNELVFVDDLGGNLKPAAELGFATVLHKSAAETIPQLEDLLGVKLGR
jgi:putative hydrolase of the HAD superfamily